MTIEKLCCFIGSNIYDFFQLYNPEARISPSPFPPISPFYSLVGTSTGSGAEAGSGSVAGAGSGAGAISSLAGGGSTAGAGSAEGAGGLSADGGAGDGSLAGGVLTVGSAAPAVVPEDEGWESAEGTGVGSLAVGIEGEGLG